MLETDKTELDMSRGRPKAPKGRGIKLALVMAFAILCAALGLANFRNAALQKKEAQVEEVAAKRALEIKRLTEQHVTVAVPPPPAAIMPPAVAKTSSPQAPDSGEENDPSADEESVTGKPIDGSVPSKPTEKW